MNQAGRSAIASEAGEYVEVNLFCLRATELRSVCVCGHARRHVCSYSSHTADHTPPTQALQALKVIS
jgi:hypothetical protein